MGSPQVFSGVCIAHLFSFLYCVFCFICLHPVTGILNVAIVSGLSILEILPLQFSLSFI